MSEIGANKVVSFHYQMYRVENGERGKLLEESHAEQPIVYLHGHGNIIPGLEEAMQGKKEGDKFHVTLTPEQAYGPRRPNAIQRVPIKHLLLGNKKQRLLPGMIVSVQTDRGPRQVVVVKAGKFTVDVDINHPLAGMTLDYEIEVHSIRDADAEEIAHGHAHGPGGHNH